MAIEEQETVEEVPAEPTPPPAPPADKPAEPAAEGAAGEAAAPPEGEAAAAEAAPAPPPEPEKKKTKKVKRIALGVASKGQGITPQELIDAQEAEGACARLEPRGRLAGSLQLHVRASARAGNTGTCSAAVIWPGPGIDQHL